MDIGTEQTDLLPFFIHVADFMYSTRVLCLQIIKFIAESF